MQVNYKKRDGPKTMWDAETYIVKSKLEPMGTQKLNKLQLNDMILEIIRVNWLSA